MAIARDTTAANIKVPNKQACIVRRFTAGSAIAAGELVSLSSDGYIDPSDSTAAKNPVLGVALQAAAAAAIDIDVVTFGPVVCLTGATPGALVYNSTTAGEPLETVAGNQTSAGIAETATILFVRPANA
jgi:hypothetical protein